MQAEALDAFSALAELAELAETNSDPPIEEPASSSKRRRPDSNEGNAHVGPSSSGRTPGKHLTSDNVPDPLEAACQAWCQELKQQQLQWQQRCEHLAQHGGAKVLVSAGPIYDAWCKHH